MEKTRYRLDGIYDFRTLKFAIEKGVFDFGIDFIPTSMNFCQLHVFIDLLKKSQDLSNQFFLQFKGDSEIVINKILEDIGKELPNIPGQRYPLEFWDQRGPKFFDQFEHPYYWRYTPDGQFKNIMEGKHLRGIVLDYDFLEGLHQQNGLFNFVQTFMQLTSFKGIDVVLKMNWKNDILPSLFESFDIDTVALPIDQSVEVCYRNVDLKKVGENLNYYKSTLPLTTNGYRQR